ncbi:PepSY domain-containing protein [Streptomyces sp. NPDC048362]|uniref:PepSY domain-containing protein n=1 Tax=Streptomyces sp. NPDC048362 TaxID=3365539 RepID=UPI00372134EE
MDELTSECARPVARGVGLICVAAAAGALLTGCGQADDNAAGANAVQAAELAPTSPSASAPTSASASMSMSMPPSASASGGNLARDQAERKALLEKVKVGYGDALRAAVAKVSASKLVSIELKGGSKGPRWEAEVATVDGTAHTVRVDAVTGKADQAQAETEQDNDDRAKLADRLKKAKVTAQQAVQTATDKTKGTVTALELQGSHGGAPEWSVDVVTNGDWKKTTFDIDAVNRKITREHVDQD